MTMDGWTDRLSEYLDGTLGPDERAALDSHLAGCAPCRSVLADLRNVVARAAALEPVEPEADLWPGILEGIRGQDDAVRVLPLAAPSRLPRRFAFTVPQLVAAGIAVVIASGSGAWLLATRGPDATMRPAAEAADRTAGPGITFAAATDRVDDAAIAELEQALAEARDRLDPATVAVIERNLALIDEAIADAREALARDPGNAYVSRHLESTLRARLDLMRRATTIARSET